MARIDELNVVQIIGRLPSINFTSTDKRQLNDVFTVVIKLCHVFTLRIVFFPLERHFMVILEKEEKIHVSLEA